MSQAEAQGAESEMGVSEQDTDQGCSKEHYLLKGEEGGRIWMKEIEAMIQAPQSPQATILWSWDVCQICPKPREDTEPFY